MLGYLLLNFGKVMTPNILALETAVPAYAIDQNTFALNLAQALDLDQSSRNLMLKIFQNSRIKTRYSAIPDYQHPDLKGDLYSGFPQQIPDMLARNELYKKEAPELALQACRKALSSWGKASEITHVIAVSCTGMMAPGIEFILIEKLGLSSKCMRFGINFMGCFGAFRAIAVGSALASQNPNHRILIVCTELCSLHMQTKNDINTFVGNALFSDGAASIIIGAGLRAFEKPLWEIHQQSAFAIPNSLQNMTWEIGNHGFLMHLSEKVPASIKKYIFQFIQELIGPERILDDYAWAVHPGGKAILNAVANVCNLNSSKDLSLSWEVLEKFGNMSSATFLFVLDMMRKNEKSKEWSIGLGFGPGLSLEGVLLKNVFE